MIRVVAMIGLFAIAACTPPTPAQVADRCEQRARDAQGPTGNISVGANNRSGTFVSGEIGVTTDFLAGRDPVQVYEQCVIAATGELPIRPPVLKR